MKETYRVTLEVEIEVTMSDDFKSSAKNQNVSHKDFAEFIAVTGINQIKHSLEVQTGAVSVEKTERI